MSKLTYVLSRLACRLEDLHTTRDGISLMDDSARLCPGETSISAPRPQRLASVPPTRLLSRIRFVKTLRSVFVVEGPDISGRVLVNMVGPSSVLSTPQAPDDNNNNQSFNNQPHVPTAGPAQGRSALPICGSNISGSLVNFHGSLLFSCFRIRYAAAPRILNLNSLPSFVKFPTCTHAVHLLRPCRSAKLIALKIIRCRG